MTLRRYQPMKPSAGTRTPAQVRLSVFSRDKYCVGRHVGFPTTCSGGLEVDHVRASHGMGLKSPTEIWNLVALCNQCHLWKTTHGREARPKLLEYLSSVGSVTR